jgi:protein-tyrosine phosphatase
MGLFSNLFSKKKVLPPADLSVLGVDVHSHFIPRVDDGSQSSKETIELLESMVKFGYKKVITTPHVMMDYYKNTPHIILEGLDKLREKVAKAGLDIEIEAAAEYYCDDFFTEFIKKKELLTFGDNYVLFELPFTAEPRMMKDCIFDMQMAGYKPVIAHPERYSFWYDDFDKFLDIRDRGVLLQLNINSLSGQYPADTKKMAEKLVANNMISFLGSDCHNINHIGMMHSAIKEEAIHNVLASGNLLNNTL